MKGRYSRLMAIAVTVVMLVSALAAAASADTASIPDAPNGVYIVRLADAPLATYGGGIEGLAGTSNRVTGASKLDASSPPSLAYRDYLAGKQAEFISAMELAVGRRVDVLFQYDVVYNGMAVELTKAEADLVARLPGVDNVQPDVIRYPTTDYGPAWIGADGIWDGSYSGGTTTMGEGVIVGILDTGLNLDHPSFAEEGPSDGYVHINPFGDGVFKGLCKTDPSNFVCNNKLVGYYIYTAEYEEDTDGHGTHTGSTTAGNVLDEGWVDLGAFSYSPAISGVAPHATVIGYDVCDAGGCAGSGSIAATNQAVLDGVDVINFSIGGGTSDPWLDGGSVAFLNATEAGLIPVTSAGNGGPGAGTIGSPADAPWMISAGAATHNRAGINGLVAMTGGDSAAPADIFGKGFSDGYGPAPIVYAGDYGDAQCLAEFPPPTFEGQIVVCDRGINARVAKGWNVLQGGAGGMILANADPSETLSGDVHHLPAVHITYADGVALKTWLATGFGHTGTITGAAIDTSPSNGDIMAGFSSRGPLVNSASDVIKPDVAAPGVDVLAAYRTGDIDAENPTSEYGVVSGTSMASPHTAGSAALLRALYPSWSPAEIASALVSTGHTDGVLKEDGTTPADAFDIGGGRVDLSGGGQPGLILDETVAGFLAANPALGGEPSELNLASMGQDACLDSCSWTRVVKNATDSTETWNATGDPAPGMSLNITPAEFTLVPGATQTIEVEAGVSGMPTGVWAFAEVTLTPDSPGVPATHLPVAVRPEEEPPAIAVTPESLASIQLPDTVEVQELTISNEGTEGLEWEIYEDAGGALLVDWYENWDAYETGVNVHGEGGWKGWDNTPSAGAYTTDEQARSSPNSIDIESGSDLVHEYSGYDTGFWTYTAWQYIPSGFSGDSFFILLNQYADAGPYNWSTEVHFQSATGLVIFDGVATGAPLPIIYDEWVELRVEIDLVNDTQEFYYGGDLLYEASWTECVSGSGSLSIGAVDLFANGASSIFYDDLSLVEAVPDICDLPSDIPWASVSPDMGTTPGGDSSLVDVTFDSTGLVVGSYEGTLCVSSNDPVTPIVPVPLALEVVETIPTMHVGGIEGYFSVDYLGRPILRMHVYVEDEFMAPLSEVAVDASIWAPDAGPIPRTRYTKLSGNARFHWGSTAAGTWTLCVEDLTLAGYEYVVSDNVVTCMDWYN